MIWFFVLAKTINYLILACDTTPEHLFSYRCKIERIKAALPFYEHTMR